jgi:hypothetical protein
MKMLTTAATLAAILVSAGVAMAAPVPGSNVPVTTPGHRNQSVSNENLRTARRHIERAIDRLQHDTEDYGGHRETAIDDLGIARQFLDQGLAFRGSRGSGNGTPIPIDNPGKIPGSNVPVTTPGGHPIPIDNPGTIPGGQHQTGNEFERGQAASNANLTAVRTHIEAAIDALNRDSSDYGGYKERAIDRLQQARSEIDAALDFVHRSGVQNGGPGQHVSDANLQFVNEHVQTAISRLEQDRKDYGGHRVAAINDLQTARGYINSALQYDNSHHNASTMGGVLPATTSTVPIGRPGTIGQGASNQSIADARSHVETAIDALNRDAHDYGGFRVKAMDALQAARNELIQALNFR